MLGSNPGCCQMYIMQIVCHLELTSFALFLQNCFTQSVHMSECWECWTTFSTRNSLKRPSYLLLTSRTSSPTWRRFYTCMVRTHTHKHEKFLSMHDCSWTIKTQLKKNQGSENQDKVNKVKQNYAILTKKKNLNCIHTAPSHWHSVFSSLYQTHTLSLTHWLSIGASPLNFSFNTGANGSRSEEKWVFSNWSDRRWLALLGEYNSLAEIVFPLSDISLYWIYFKMTDVVGIKQIVHKEIELLAWNCFIVEKSVDVGMWDCSPQS